MIDVLIIGAGIVGSWTALELARQGKQVAVCDTTSNGADGISGRNSGVLHAGIYYAKDSLKAKHSVEGRKFNIEFARQHNVPMELCGKLIISGKTNTPIQKENAQIRLEQLLEQAIQNGVDDIQLIQNPAKLCQHLHGDIALHSPGTGVIDAPTLLKAVQREAELAGVFFLWKREFIAADGKQIQLRTVQNKNSDPSQNETIEEIESEIIINAAGLHSDSIANHFGLSQYTIRPNRGEYYRLAKRLPDNMLVYPLPATDSTALGVHYTFHCNGDAYAGPNSVWAEHKSDYNISMDRTTFYNSLLKITDYYTESDLSPGYSGLRPRLFDKEQAVKDFVIERHPHNVIHLLGIESPGLTSAPSLAKEIASMI